MWRDLRERYRSLRAERRLDTLTTVLEMNEKQPKFVSPLTILFLNHSCGYAPIRLCSQNLSFMFEYILVFSFACFLPLSFLCQIHLMTF